MSRIDQDSVANESTNRPNMFYKILFSEFPEFVADSTYNKEDYDNSYLLIYEFQRFFVDVFRRFKSDNSSREAKLFKNMCNFIEKCLQDKDENISTLIATGFLENLINVAHDDYPEIKRHLGTQSIKYLEYFDG